MIQNPFFPEIHGNFGFGCMRLPMKDAQLFRHSPRLSGRTVRDSDPGLCSETS